MPILADLKKEKVKKTKKLSTKVEGSSSSSSSSSKPKKSKSTRTKTTKRDDDMMDMISPTGMTDFVPPIVVKDLNSSFSWANSGPSPSIRQQLKDIQARLEWLKEQRIKDKEEFKIKLHKAKLEAHRELHDKYDPLIKIAKNSDKQKSVDETSKIIQYLKDDNTKVREEMNYYAKEIVKLQKNNEQVEKANKSAQASFEELQNHVKGLEAVQRKLKDNCEVFKTHLAKMKKDLRARNDFYRYETKAGGLYEHCLAKVLASIKEKSRDAKLIESVYSLAGEGSLKANSGRDEILAQKGLSREERPFVLGSTHEPISSASDTDSDSEEEE